VHGARRMRQCRALQRAHAERLGAGTGTARGSHLPHAVTRGGHVRCTQALACAAQRASPSAASIRSTAADAAMT